MSEDTFASPALEPARTRPDPRLPGYLLAGLSALIAAVASGRPEFAALAAPFLTLAAAGLANRAHHHAVGAVSLDQAVVFEEDVIQGEVRADWSGVAEVDLVLTGMRGVDPIEPAPVVGWSLAAGTGPVTRSFQLRATSWGIHEMGTLWIRVRRPGGLMFWEQKLSKVPSVRVLPRPQRLKRLLRPAEPRTVSGFHLSRQKGKGTDFAELRPYQPGDRLRDLSWSTSARLGSPWVTVHHPERTGTVLLLLDAFFMGEGGENEALARAARAGWAITSIHLAAQDRVGLLATGRAAAWVSPQGGKRARLQLLEELLAVGGAAEDHGRRRARRGRTTIPADALIVGVTTLRSDLFMQDLLHLRRTGHTTVAMVIDTSDLLRPDGTLVHEAAARIWHAQRRDRRRLLEKNGVPTALVTGDGGAGSAISALRRAMRGTRRHVRAG